MNNPYFPRQPVEGEEGFHGRIQELQEIASFIRGNQSIAIVGPRGIGKTLLLLQLMHSESQGGVELGLEHLLVYQDCQTLSQETSDGIFAALRDGLSAVFPGRGSESPPILEAPPEGPARMGFETVLRQVNQRGHRVVFLLDNFEGLAANPHLEVNFFNALRSAAARCQLVWVTASTRPLIELTFSDRSENMISSPFFNIFSPLFLGMLAEPEARALIRERIGSGGRRVLPGLKEFIFQLVGGHPLALQVACTHALNAPDDLAGIERKTREDLEPLFQSYWQDLTPAEREVVSDLRQATERQVAEPGVRVALRDLKRECLLVEAGAVYRYPSRAWAEFVAAQRDTPVKAPSRRCHTATA